MTRPNILFLMSDEHRFDLTGFSGNQIVRTPHLDALAKTGVVFNNAYTPSPICAPARQCMMSGQLPKTCGVDGAWMDLKPEYHTFARRFSQYAYHTVCAGKLHHFGVDQMQGWTMRLASDSEIFPKYYDGLVKEEFDKYPSKPVSVKKTNETYVKEAGIKFGKYQLWDSQIFDASIDFIQSHYAHHQPNEINRPLFLKISFMQPHYPFYTNKEMFGYYLNRVPIFDEKICDHPVLSQSQIEKPVNVSKEEIRNATATYYGMVETVDAYYGKILETLKSVGQNLDDWIIIFTSDHGEMLGQHGIWEKARFYEGSVRVPLMIRYPKKFGGGKTINENVSLCDLFATLCDLSGIPSQPGLDSRTLVPLLTSSQNNWNNEVVSQIKRKNNYHVMIKQDNLKYQYYGDSIKEVLFDLKIDSHEDHNLIDNQKYTEVVKKFRIRLGELGYGTFAIDSYKNAGYLSGVEEKLTGTGKLWPEDSNPWM